MALQFARLWQQRGSDIIDDFFERSREAEEKRAAEYQAAVYVQKMWRGFKCRIHLADIACRVVTIQRMYRGFRGRKMFKHEWYRQRLEKETAYQNQMATKIQRTWRGFDTRKRIFDYHKRKEFIETVSAKMEETRENLRKHEQQQRKDELERKAKKLLEWMEQFAGKNHHLLGTKSIPGILSKSPTIVNDDLIKIIEELKKKEAEGRATTPEEMIAKKKLLGPIVGKIPENKLRHSEELQEWIKGHVGKNPYGIRVKPKPDPIELSEPEAKEKPVQGPFLPKINLEKKKSKPLRPSLRVQTDYFDTHNYKREERRQELARRVSDKVFVTLRHIKYDQNSCYISGGPYKRIKGFREVDRTKFIAKKDFKTIIPPIPLFENAMDDY
ncbi:spermatogenesis-associated protein 17 [Phlyctochytrium planicorne]|nr:spermatogenesis-associated protein 17 [Phlyctochytrium planicorne]